MKQKLSNFFNKRKNSNLKRPYSKKQRIIGTGVLAGNLIFGNLKSDFREIQNYSNATPLAHERVVSNQELDSLDDPNSRVILVKTGDSLPSPGRGQPTNFPSGTTGGRGTPHVNIYKTPPKLVDQRLGAAPSPAGAGGGAAEFDDNSPVPNEEKSQESQESKTFDYDYRSNDPKNKKQSKDQCQHRILTHRIKEDKGLIRAAEEACRNKKVQRDLNDLEEKLANGNDNPGTHKKYLGNNVWEHRGRKGGRLYTREIDNNIDILAKSGKKPSNQQYVINRVKELYIE